MSTRAVVVDILSLSSPSKKSGCSELLSEPEELGLKEGGGEAGHNGEGREAGELSNAQEIMEGDAGADGAQTVEEEEQEVWANGGVGVAGVWEEPDTCLLRF